MSEISFPQFITNSFPEVSPRNICITTTEINGSNGSAKKYFKNFTYDEILARPELIKDKAYYVGISSIDGKCDEKGNVKRTKDHLQILYMVVLDDIGQVKNGKMIVAPEVEPSYIMETSPGNFQYGYYITELHLQEDEEAEAKGAAFIDACIESGYSDPGAKGTYRVVRAPGSVNIKEGMDGFRSRIVKWNPSRYWALDALAEQFEITELWKKIQKEGVTKKSVEEKLVAADNFEEYSNMLLENPIYLTSADRKIGDVLFTLREMTADSLPNYSDWLNVGLSLSTIVPKSLGYEIFHMWSRDGTGYNPADWPDKWKSFTGTARGLNSIFRDADRAGIKTTRSIPKESDLFKAINKQCFYTVRGGKSFVGIVPSMINRKLHPNSPPVTFLAPNTFYDKTASLRTINEEGEILGGVGQRWFKSPFREQYDGVQLTPPPYRAPPTLYNLWQGFSVAPTEQCCPLFEGHIRDVLGEGIPEYGDYLIKFFAWTLQNPGKIPGVMLVLKGSKGAGKSIISEAIRSIFGPHGIVIDHDDGITGKFNSQLEGACYVALEESGWAGDRKGQGKMKALITQKKVMYEAKGLDAIQGDNRATFVLTTNHSWAVPASKDERRFAVFSISDHQVGNEPYFKALAEEIDVNLGGILGWLSRVDLTGFHPAACIPETEALKEQKELSQSFNEEFVYEFLIEELQKSKPFNRIEFGGESVDDTEYLVNDEENLLVPKRWLHQKVIQMIHKKNRNTKISVTRITKDLKSLWPKNEDIQFKRVSKTNVRQYNFYSEDYLIERLVKVCGVDPETFH